MPENTTGTHSVAYLPVDHFSRRLRELTDNPGAVRATSTIQAQDFYGNAESWIVTTFRLDGAEVVFLERISADPQPIRIVLPPAVTAAIGRQRDRAVTAVRRRVGRSTHALRVARGDDPAAPLRKHQKAKGGR